VRRQLLSDAGDEPLVATEGDAVVEDPYWVYGNKLHPHWQDWSWGNAQVRATKRHALQV